MTTLTTTEPVVEPTSTEAEITHLTERRRQVAIGAVYRALTSDAAFHLPYVLGWRLITMPSDWYPEIQGQLGMYRDDVHLGEDDVVLAVTQWAEHLGAESVDHEPLPHGGRVQCAAVMNGVRVQIWGSFDHPTDNVSEASA
jgi:hypothetical protein